MSGSRFAVGVVAALLLSSAAGVTVAGLAPGGGTTPGGGPDVGNSSGPCVGTVTDRPETGTVVSIQGVELTPDGYEKRPAFLASYAPDGSFEWVRNASANGRWWAYDVDRTADGDLLFVTTERDGTVVGELAPNGSEYEWVRRFDGDPDDATTPLVTDAHDADLIGEDRLVLADKGQGHERLLVYNLTRDRVTWEWRFEDHPEAFPEDAGGPPDDWTHVNDVDAVGDDWFMVSVRNFDQVAFVNRTTGEVDLTLGSDGDHDVLYEQHNPDYLRGPGGGHTVLVADSENDRVVEYEYDADGESWERVWSVGGLDEPRDADRLPNGNTLVTDRMGHRVVEVTPRGEVVWEVYTPYEPYDAERGGPGSEGPTMREHGVSGNFTVHGGNASERAITDCARYLYEFASGEWTSGSTGTGDAGER